MMDCTIDVWILKTVKAGGEDYHNCVLFLEMIIETRCKVCVDNQGELLESYNKLVDYRNPADFIGRWWKHMQRNLKIVWPKLPTKIHNELSTLRFDEDDLIYVEIANASIDRKIVTGDSDFGCNPRSQKNREDIKSYLKNQLDVTPLTPEEAKNELFRANASSLTHL